VAAALKADVLGAKIAAGETKGLRGATGTPDQLREYLRRYEEAGVDQVIFVMQAGRNRHEHICESLELFGREVLPEFAERDDAVVAAKAERLAPAVDAAMARKVDHAPPLPDGYSFGALPKQLADRSGSEQIKQFLDQFADATATGEAESAFNLLK
jgi:hypothetical protein